MFQRIRISSISCALCGLLTVLTDSGQAQVTVETVLNYQPTHKGIDIETPSREEIAQCKLEVERGDGGAGWALYGPQGQVLRRFMDTNNDQRVDEYRYYKHGLEVYRDLDTNGNNEIDQSRWLNTAGSRWGVDSDEDKRIDSWKMISAEEATQEAILAMATRDERRLAAVMINANDLQTLGITGNAAAKLSSNIKEAGAKLRSILSTTKILNPNTKWVRFDCSMLMPNLIPAEPSKTKKDLLVYENVMAMVDNNGETGFVQIGEMVRVGDAWKLTQVPQPMEGDRLEVTEGGILLQPAIVGLASAPELSPRMKQLVEQLTKLDEGAPQANATNEEITRYNVARAKLLASLAEETTSAEEKIMWIRQRLEGIAAATQMETYPNGIEELRRAEQELRQAASDQDLLAFAAFQRMLAEYNLALQKASADDRAKVQENWLTTLEGFVREFPQSAEAADALLQLAVTQEFNGKIDDAKKWYQKLVQNYPQTQPAKRGEGALRRLNLQGTSFRLTGQALNGGKIDTAAYRGKVLAVIFWATWCKPCTEDLPQIQELYKTYHKDGFEIIGVNLDSPGAPIDAYIRNFRITWPHIHEEGALECRPAVEYGVISLPTMFLIDKKGTVVDASASVEDLKTLVPDLVKQ